MSETREQALRNLRAVIQGAKLVFKRAWLDESAFFIATYRLKKSFALHDRFLDSASISGSIPSCMTAIDDIEQTVEEGQAHFMGKVLVPIVKLEAGLQAIEASLVGFDQKAAEWEAANPPGPEDILAAARREAEAIIADARQQADLIKTGMSPGPQNGPWSS